MVDEFLMSKTSRSASYPTAILPLGTENSLPGFSAPMRTAWAIGMTSLRTMSMVPADHVHDDGSRRLHARDPAGGGVELLGLLLRGVRGLIRTEHVHIP